MRTSTLLSLERQFAFYNSYHANSTNRKIHCVSVPIVLITTLSLVSLISLPAPINDLSRLVVLIYLMYYVFLNPKIGLLFSPFVCAMYYSSRLLCDYIGPVALLPWVGAINFIGWFAQLVGHYGFEGKSPAFMDSVLQALLAAPIVIWLDAVFSMGLMPDTKARFLRAHVAAKARKAVARKAT